MHRVPEDLAELPDPDDLIDEAADAGCEKECVKRH
jgi:hypothetical protein